MNQIIIEMSHLDCPICLGRSWVFPRNDSEVNKIQCGWCNSSIQAIFNQEFIERNIESFMKEQY